MKQLSSLKQPRSTEALRGAATPHKVLIADDARINRFLLERTVMEQGMQPLMAADGDEAMRLLEEHHDVSLALLDWMMPGKSGLEVCRAIRRANLDRYVYIIMVTSRDRPEDLHAGLAAGADDYLSKGIHAIELKLRIAAAVRLLDLQRELTGKIAQLQRARHAVDALQELLPMCMYCKNVRDDEGYWHKVEQYIHNARGMNVSHGICPTCLTARLAELDI
ncbi:MAG: response regulator [bacterium]